MGHFWRNLRKFSNTHMRQENGEERARERWEVNKIFIWDLVRKSFLVINNVGSCIIV